MSWVAFDTETTGIEPGSRMLELAAIHFDESGEVISRFESMVNPGMPLPADAQAVNRIDAETISFAPPADEVILRFLEWMPDGCPMVAHFASFDCGILDWEAQRFGIYMLPYSAKVFDTWKMAKAIGATANNKLTTLIEHYSIPVIGFAHRAMADADACMKYFMLASKLTEPAAVEFELTGYDYGYPNEIPPILGNLPRLIETGAPLSMTYRDAKEQVTDRTIIPYGFAQKADAFHFHGMCQMRNERRTFRADRVVSVRAA